MLTHASLQQEYFQNLPSNMLFHTQCLDARIATECGGPVTAACSDTWVASICHCVPQHAGEEAERKRDERRLYARPQCYVLRLCLLN